MDIPETRYAKTVDGVYIAFRVVGAGSIDLVGTRYREPRRGLLGGTATRSFIGRRSLPSTVHVRRRRIAARFKTE